MTQNLLIPKNFKFLGKDQPTLYKEAMEKKVQPPPSKQSPKTIITSNSFGNVVPLIGSDGKTNEFTAMEALAEAKKQNKILASLKDADAYVLKNGNYYWTGDFIAYAKPGEKLGNELNYKDGNNVSYKMQISLNFQHLTGETALILPYGNDSQNPNYEFIQGANNLWTVKINEPSLIVPTLIKRNDGWYEADANMFPNGKSTDGKNASDRYFWQVDGGTYLGLLQRDDVDCRRVVYANRRPSIRRRVLVYE